MNSLRRNTGIYFTAYDRTNQNLFPESIATTPDILTVNYEFNRKIYPEEEVTQLPPSIVQHLSGGRIEKHIASFNAIDLLADLDLPFYYGPHINELFSNMVEYWNDTNQPLRMMIKIEEVSVVPASDYAYLIPEQRQREYSNEAIVAETVKYDGFVPSELTCPICIEDVEIGSQIATMPCCHTFHGDCINKWLLFNNSCPICRCPVQHSVYDS